MGFAHLDLKLENILLDEFFNIKVADMGSSQNLAGSNGLSDKRRGTLLYMAPEVLGLMDGQTFNGFSADVYSLGITLFVLLTGEFPTSEDFSESLSTGEFSTKNTTPDDVSMEESDTFKLSWGNLSKEVRQLIQQMIEPNPLLRPTIDEVLSSSWFDQENSHSILEDVYSEMSSRKNYMLDNYKK